MRADVASQPARDESRDRQQGEDGDGFAGCVVADASTRAISAASPTIMSERTRWKRPASECGQGSNGLTISRPRSESVQASLRGHPLQTCALAR